MHEIRLAVCHPEEAARAGVAARLRGATVEPCADLARFRGPPDGCDAVMLAGPTEPAAVERLFSAKAHVLLVAEPCASLNVIEALSAASRKYEVQFTIVNPERYLPSRQLIRKQLPGTLGEAGLIRLHRWESAAPDSNALPDALIRDLDVTLWLAGRQPERLYAVERKSEGVSGRHLQVHLGFAQGGMALLDYTNRLPPGDGYQSLCVIAASGAAYADDHQNEQLLYQGERPRAVRTEERAGQLPAMAQEFVDALREGRNLSANTASWKDVFAVADAVRESLVSGRAVVVEER